MIRGTAISRIARRLGNRTNLNADILEEMDLLQQTAFERNGRILPWFLETETAQASATIDEERLPLPTDFLREHEEGCLYVYATDEDNPWICLTKLDHDVMVAKYGEEAAGRPETYSLSASYFRLRPIPDAAYTMKMIYVASDTLFSDLASDSETNLWLTYAPDLVVAATAQECARHLLHDEPLALSFQSNIDKAWERILVETEARKHTNRAYQMGES